MRNIKRNVTYLGEELQERVEYWQKQLRLQDWIVTAKVARYHELEQGCDAQILHTVMNKEADLFLMSPDDIAGDEAYDMDWLIVHELLHLHITPICDEEYKAVETEQAIESMTFGYIELERRGHDDADGV